MGPARSLQSITHVQKWLTHAIGGGGVLSIPAQIQGVRFTPPSNGLSLHCVFIITTHGEPEYSI